MDYQLYLTKKIQFNTYLFINKSQKDMFRNNKLDCSKLIFNLFMTDFTKLTNIY